MAEPVVRTSTERRIRRLTEAYETILGRYREIERLSRRERRLLRNGNSIAKVNEILRAKKEVLGAVRVEEERVTGEREWWKKSRRSLPPAICRDLLSLLDAISRTIEGTVGLEAECRALLQAAMTLRPQAAARPESVSRTATLAYTRGSEGGAA